MGARLAGGGGETSLAFTSGDGVTLICVGEASAVLARGAASRGAGAAVRGREAAGVSVAVAVVGAGVEASGAGSSARGAGVPPREKLRSSRGPTTSAAGGVVGC